MINKKSILILLCIFCISGCGYRNIPINESLLRATAACSIAGSKISSKDTIEKKYKRKDCPVCKGKGWYISGDDIAKVDCGYCEPEQKLESMKPETLIRRR